MLLLILLYKNLFILFISIKLIKLVFILMYILLLILAVKNMFLTKRRYSFFELYNILFIVFFIVLLLKSLIIKYQYTEIMYVFISFQQLFIPFSFILIFLFVKFDYLKIVNKITYYSIPIFLFTLLEIFIPKEIIIYLVNTMQDQKYGGHIDFLRGAYYFNDLGFHFMRQGSLFFEPLSLSIYSSILLVTNLSFKKKNYIYLMGLNIILSFGKSGILVYVSSLFSKIVKKKIIIFYLIFILLFAYIYLVYLVDMSMKELKIVFYTVGPHFFGLIGGLLNATVHPYIGFGLGTAGYLIRKEFVNINQLTNFYLPENIIESNGNESFIGVLVYQTGYIFTMLYIFIYLYLSYKLYKLQEYTMLGMIMGVLFISFMTESTLTLLLMILPLLFSIALIKLKGKI